MRLSEAEKKIHAPRRDDLCAYKAHMQLPEKMLSSGEQISRNTRESFTESALNLINVLAITDKNGEAEKRCFNFLTRYVLFKKFRIAHDIDSIDILTFLYFLCATHRFLRAVF